MDHSSALNVYDSNVALRFMAACVGLKILTVVQAMLWCVGFSFRCCDRNRETNTSRHRTETKEMRQGLDII